MEGLSNRALWKLQLRFCWWFQVSIRNCGRLSRNIWRLLENTQILSKIHSDTGFWLKTLSISNYNFIHRIPVISIHIGSNGQLRSVVFSSQNYSDSAELRYQFNHTLTSVSLTPVVVMLGEIVSVFVLPFLHMHRLVLKLEFL